MASTTALPSTMEALVMDPTAAPNPSATGLQFNSVDYVMFILMMLLSALIGVYYGCYKKQDSVSEYLHGGKVMGVIPIAMSLISSNVSGITMLAVPSEMYLYGTQFALVAIMVFPATLVSMYLIIPMFYKLQCNSSFEYLEMRFNRTTRVLASFLFALGQLLYMPVVIYVPCLALNQVSGISVHVISPIACLVCIFYTSLGGMKAVVWTDALQLTLLLLASVVVIILGLIRVGGAGVVLEKALEGNRLELFNMDTSLYARCTFWNLCVGAFLNLVLHIGASPSSVQRFLCVSSLGAAQRTSMVLALGYFATKVFSVCTGLIVFASYFYCDPLKNGVVHKGDQLVPYFVMDVAQDWPGLSGLFVAGVFSAALSTMSAGLNTLSATMYTDFIEKCLPMKVSDERASTHMKILSLAIGAVCVVLIFVVEHLGGILQVAISMSGITAGASFGLFFLGMFFPTANGKGAVAGGITSLIFMAVVVTGNSYSIATGAIKYATLPTRTDGCVANSTMDLLSTTAMPVEPADEADGVFPLFKVSYFYFGLMGMLVNILVALVVSHMTGANRLEDADPDLFSPVVARFLSRKQRSLEQQKQQELQQLQQLQQLQEYKIVPSADTRCSN